MFHLKGATGAPQVYLRPKEMLHIPLKYQTFASDYVSQVNTERDAVCVLGAQCVRSNHAGEKNGLSWWCDVPAASFVILGKT